MAPLLPMHVPMSFPEQLANCLNHGVLGQPTMALQQSHPLLPMHSLFSLPAHLYDIIMKPVMLHQPHPYRPMSGLVDAPQRGLTTLLQWPALQQPALQQSALQQSALLQSLQQSFSFRPKNAQPRVDDHSHAWMLARSR